MDRTKLLATATAVVLTVTGGVSALFLAVGAADSSATSAPSTTEIVEYVDAEGNPLPAAATGVAAPAADVDGGEPGAPAYAEGGEYEEHEEHEEEEYEDDDHENDEYDEEYEDGDHGQEEDHD